MSYSSKIKDELARVMPSARHCLLSELSAIISLSGVIAKSKAGEYNLTIKTEHSGVARKYFTLLKKTFNISTDVAIENNARGSYKHIYTVELSDAKQIDTVLKAVKLDKDNLELYDSTLLTKSCCKRAYIRGAFLASGSVTNPEKSYHMELVCQTKDKADKLIDIFSSLGIEARIIMRKKSYIVYIKEGDMIVEALGLMEAPSSLMELENVRILKGVRNDINRRVNCETANITKTVSAASRQLEEINYIKDTVGLKKLPDNLRQLALLRLKHNEASLKELGELLNPKVGKSGINHRMQKIMDYAQELRERS